MKTIRITLVAALAAVLLPALVAAQPTIFTLETARRAWLGFSYEPVVQLDRRAAPAGVVVRSIVAASPAERAGIEVGDTIVRINDINATDALLSSLGSALSPGDEVRVRVQRAGRSHDFTVVAARPPAEYQSFGSNTGVFRFDQDSVRSMFRLFIDSARTRVDSMRLPEFYVDGRNWTGRLRMDSLRSGFQWDTTFVRGDSVTVFRFFSSDTMRTQFDSLRARMLGNQDRLMILRDSMRYHFNVPGGATIFTSPDSVAWSFGAGSPMAVSVWGQSAIAGAELTRVDPSLGEYFGVDAGVLVVRVPRDTPAARAGLEGGDVIVEAAGRLVSSVDELRRAIQRAPGSDPVPLEIVRRKARSTVHLPRN